MADKFSGAEIVRMGIQIEKNGHDFYCALAQKSVNEQAKNIFKYLAAEEEKHIAIFQGLLGQDAIFEYLSDDYFNYLNTLVSEYVFTKKEKIKDIVKRINRDIEAVDLGIKFEKDTLIFYDKMKEAILKPDRRVLAELLKQEKKHLQGLNKLRIELIKLES